MEVIVRIIKSNPWTGLTKWSKCFDYLSPYYTRTGNYYTGLTPQQAIEFEKKLVHDEEGADEILNNYTSDNAIDSDNDIFNLIDSMYDEEEK